MANVILSDSEIAVCRALEARGFNIIPSCTVAPFIGYEQRHADMQCLIIDDTAFVLSCCEALCDALSPRYKVIPCGENIGGKYPANIALNALVIDKTIIGNLPFVDKKVTDYCRERSFRMIPVKQGYTRCSVLAIGDHALITADRGIYRTLIGERGFDDSNLLLIESDDITLGGNTDGFIGGASGYYDGTVYFTGNIRRHKSYNQIKTFCDLHQTKIISLTNEPLIDIGGMIFC